MNKKGGEGDRTNEKYSRSSFVRATNKTNRINSITKNKKIEIQDKSLKHTEVININMIVPTSLHLIL